jgi:hypothetical protein
MGNIFSEEHDEDQEKQNEIEEESNNSFFGFDFGFGNEKSEEDIDTENTNKKKSKRVKFDEKFSFDDETLNKSNTTSHVKTRKRRSTGKSIKTKSNKRY